MTLPVLLYEFWAFIAPALWPEEKRAVLLILPAAVLLFYVGLVFAYYFVVPAAVGFFIGFATQTLQPMFSLEAYLSFIMALTLPFGFIFELPLVVIFLAKLGLVSGEFLRSKRKILIVISFVLRLSSRRRRMLLRNRSLPCLLLSFMKSVYGLSDLPCINKSCIQYL